MYSLLLLCSMCILHFTEAVISTMWSAVIFRQRYAVDFACVVDFFWCGTQMQSNLSCDNIQRESSVAVSTGCCTETTRFVVWWKLWAPLLIGGNAVTWYSTLWNAEPCRRSTVKKSKTLNRHVIAILNFMLIHTELFSNVSGLGLEKITWMSTWCWVIWPF